MNVAGPAIELVVEVEPVVVPTEISAGTTAVVVALTPAPAPASKPPLPPVPADGLEVGIAVTGIGTRPTPPPPRVAAGPVTVPVDGCAVTNVTCGTVTAVVMTEPPDAVCVKVTVVTGTATGGCVTGGRGPRPLPLVITVPVAVAVAVVVAVSVGGIGTKVMVLGTPVQIPGFCGTKFAQMPAR